MSPARPSYSTPSNVNLTAPSRYERITRWVAVSRSTLNQRRQPAECTQRSANGPFGLSRTNRYAAPLGVGERVRVGRVRHVRLPAVAELDLVAVAAPGAGDEQHQCATAAAPCSSISAPVSNRSSANGTFSGCGSPCAIVCA